MACTRLSLFVTYSQVAVFMASLDNPFNDWTQQHVNQGFAWRPGSVSFRTLIESGRIDAELFVDEEPPLSDDAIRIIEVPFDVPIDGKVEIASMSDSICTDLPPGRYSLRYESLAPISDLSAHMRLYFTKNEASEFRIIRADTGLSIRDELLTTASPA